MTDADAAEFLSSYGLTESGLVRLIRTTYALLGVISFFTIGEDECRAWTIPVNTRAVEAAGAIHSDLSKHFIRAETIRWDQLLEAGSEANARSKGILRLEGKEYIVQDGDVMHVRHSGYLHSRPPLYTPVPRLEFPVLSCVQMSHLSECFHA